MSRVMKIQTELIPNWDNSGLTYFIVRDDDTDSFIEGRFGSASHVGKTFQEELGIAKRCFGSGVTRIAFLENFAVDPSRRGRGIGSTLLDEALEFLHDQGVRSVHGVASPEFTQDFWALVGLYERHGFSVVEECSQPGSAWIVQDLEEVR